MQHVCLYIYIYTYIGVTSLNRCAWQNVWLSWEHVWYPWQNVRYLWQTVRIFVHVSVLLLFLCVIIVLYALLSSLFLFVRFCCANCAYLEKHMANCRALAALL